MIDAHARAVELVRKMEAHLPIPARPTGAFIRAMRERGVKLPTTRICKSRTCFTSVTRAAFRAT